MKNRIKLFITTFLVLCLLLCCSCGTITPSKRIVNSKLENFSVHFIDVGQGDCIYINLPDNKNVIIDSGFESEDNYDIIKRYLLAYNANKIDYLILSHPDSDHIGNMCEILNNFTVEKVFIPDIVDVQNFSIFNDIMEIISQKDISYNISTFGKTIIGQDYSFLFLSPLDRSDAKSPYNKINGNSNYNSDETNDISAVIYLQYKGVRFLFTGDASSSQEDIIIENNKLKNYSFMLDDFVLEDIDFLKVAHHGSYTSSSESFLKVVKPKNAIISVGGNNLYGHPAKQTITNILTSNENCNIYRTDYFGTISIFVNENGNYQVVKESENN